MNDYAKFLGFKGVLPGQNRQIVLAHGSSLIVETSMNISRQELLACGNGLYASFGAASFDSLLNALTMLGGRFDSIKVAVPTGGKDGHRDIYTLNEYIESHMPSADALVAPPRPEPTPDWRKSLTAQPA